MLHKKVYVLLRKLIAKMRVYWWVFRHPEELVFFHCLDSADHWIKAEDAKVDSNGTVVEWIDHRKVHPDWYKEIVEEKIIKELEIICSDHK